MPPPLPQITLSLPLTYPLRRRIALPQAWSWLFVLGTLGFFGILVPLNIATQGYQTVSVYFNDYNTTNWKWYNHFTPHFLKKESACQTHLFTAGDTTATNHGVFMWSLGTSGAVPSHDNKPKNGEYESKDGSDWLISEYKGNTTGWCDILEVLLSADTSTWITSLEALVLCYDTSGITGTSKVFAGSQVYSLKSDADGLLNSGLQLWPMLAAGDALFALNKTKALTTADSQVSQLSIYSYMDVCPQQILVNRDRFLWEARNWTDISWCEPEDIYAPPKLDIDWEDASSWPHGNMSSDVIGLLNNSVNNAMQVMVAAVRFDLGNRLPNNFITNPTVFNDTFLPPYPSLTSSNTTTYLQGEIYSQFFETGNVDTYNATAYQNESRWQTTYLCQQSEWKSAGSGFIAVLVATVSLGGSAWAMVMLALSFWAKRGNPDADCCEYHASLSTPEATPTKLEMEQHVPRLEMV